MHSGADDWRSGFSSNPKPSLSARIFPRLPIESQNLMMVRMETFNRGDEVLSSFLVDSIMTVLAVEGLKVRCSDNQDGQY
jgi:hypothetical protein